MSAVSDGVLELRGVSRDQLTESLPELGGCLGVVPLLAVEEFFVEFQYDSCDDNCYNTRELIVPLLALEERFFIIGRCGHSTYLCAFDTGFCQNRLRDRDGDVIKRDVHSREWFPGFVEKLEATVYPGAFVLRIRAHSVRSVREYDLIRWKGFFAPR